MVRVAVMTFRLHAPWVHSLKEKRSVVKSLLAKLKNRFALSAAEVGDQDVHQSIVIAAAAIVPDRVKGDALMEAVSRFVEEATDAEVIDEEWELR